AKFIGTWMDGWPVLSRARISALALNALMSPNNLVIAAFHPGGPPEDNWACATPAAQVTRLAASASRRVFRHFISASQNVRRKYRIAWIPPSGNVRRFPGKLKIKFG